MLGRMHLRKFLALATLALLFELSSLCLSEPVWAQQNSRNSNRGLPSRRVGGATRGVSEQASQCSSLVALSPQYLVNTTEASPTLFFCIPPIEPSQAVKIEFSLRDAGNRLLYRTTVAPVTRSGIASLTLPTSNSFPELEIDRNYRWMLSLISDGSNRVAQGWIRRVEMHPNLANKLAQRSPLGRVQLYREARLWYEAIRELAQLKRARPNDPEVFQQWTQLLGSIDLSAIAQAPLLDTNLAPETSQPVLRGEGGFLRTED
jgi:hypothetical protein